MPTPTLKFYLETRREITNTKTHYVRLRITHDRKSNYCTIILNCKKLALSIEDFNKVNSNTKKSGTLEKIKTHLTEELNRAILIIRELEKKSGYTFDDFKNKFENLSESNEQNDVLLCIENYEKTLKNAGQLGSASTYNSSRRSIEKFNKEKYNRESLNFNIINIKWLREYESYMRVNGKSTTTIGMYLRPLKCVFNQAIENGDIDKSIYPFGKSRYMISTENNIKRHFSMDELQMLLNYNPVNENEQKALDIWKFSYLSYGINIVDILLLKKSRIDYYNNSFAFIREKTKRTRNNKPIVVALNDITSDILNRYNLKTSEYAFNFKLLKITENIDTNRKKIKQFTKVINSQLKKIGIKLGLSIKFTTYTARHSFATKCIWSGIPIEVISQGLGHQEYKTTKEYVGSFGLDTLANLSNSLLDFNG